MVVSGAMLFAGVIWLYGMKFLGEDTAAVENATVAAG
jgi:hypothetical protein